MIQMKRLNEVREVASEERAAKLEQKGFTRIGGSADPGSRPVTEADLEKLGKQLLDRLKGEGNSVTQGLAEEAIQNVSGLSNRERAVLWQIQNKSWKWNKNPFDKRVGREVYDRMHEEDEN